MFNKIIEKLEIAIGSKINTGKTQFENDQTVPNNYINNTHVGLSLVKDEKKEHCNTTNTSEEEESALLYFNLIIQIRSFIILNFL
jgi:hypothetical protein